MPLLFSYGALQAERVQLATFGRRLDGCHDALPGFQTSQVRIDDPAEVAASGLAQYQNVVPSSDADASVPGMALVVTEAELATADDYERPAAYMRSAVILTSGASAWVYLHAGPTPAADDIEALLRDVGPPLEAEIRAVRAILLAVDARIHEGVKWNAPSYATTEHFATFHLRAKAGVQLVLHLGAKARPGVDLRRDISDPDGLLAWKGPDRAIVTFRNLQHVGRVKTAFTRVLTQWIARV